MPTYFADGSSADALGVFVDQAATKVGARFDSQGRKRVGTTTAPAVAAGAAAGTSPTAVSVTGTDEVGTAAFTSGTTPTTGTLLTITFAQPYAATPHVIISPQDADSAAIKLSAVATTTALTISAGVAPAAGAHKIAYLVVGGA
jgi:ABC-type enterochelin transport system substrate-binding protein